MELSIATQRLIREVEEVERLLAGPKAYPWSQRCYFSCLCLTAPFNKVQKVVPRAVLLIWIRIDQHQFGNLDLDLHLSQKTGTVEAHSSEPWRLILEPWRLILEPWRLILETWRLILDHMEAHPGAMEAHPGAVEAHPGAVEAHPGDVEAHPRSHGGS